MPTPPGPLSATSPPRGAAPARPDAAAGGDPAGPPPPPGSSRYPAAVLWDLDGTLVDTEPYWIAAEFALVAEHGESWTEADAHGLVGNDLRVSAEILQRRGGVRLGIDAITDFLLDAVVARVRERIPWRPGAQALLGDLHAAGVRCALVTMSYRRLATTVVDTLPGAWFTELVCGDDVRHGKPHPEPYLEAARRLGVAPQSCVAIEDSPTGVRSAEAAGAAVLAVEHLVPIPPGPGRRLLPSLVGVRADTLLPLARGEDVPLPGAPSRAAPAAD